MIDQQSGISLESLLRGILGIVTVLAVAYALSYDRKRLEVDRRWIDYAGHICPGSSLYTVRGNSFGMDGEGVH